MPVSRLYHVRSADLPTVMMCDYEEDDNHIDSTNDTIFHTECRSALQCTWRFSCQVGALTHATQLLSHLLMLNLIPSRDFCILFRWTTSIYRR